VRRLLPALLTLALAGCATNAVEGTSALTGRELDSAVSLYGPWAEVIDVDHQRIYIWRRHAVQNGTDYYCEMRVEMGFRQTIARALTRGYPVACDLFKVQFQGHVK
jgi:hypothetical protein